LTEFETVESMSDELTLRNCDFNAQKSYTVRVWKRSIKSDEFSLFITYTFLS